MSMAIGHFAVGMAVTAILIDVLIEVDSHRTTLIVLGGVWAVLPDVHWALPGHNPTLRAIHRSVFSNVFWLHEFLDAVDGQNSRPVAAGLVVVSVVVVVLLDVRRSRTSKEAKTVQ